VRLVLAIIQSTDAEPLLSDLAAIGASATQIEGETAVASAGLAALLIGAEDDLVSDVLTLVRNRAGGRARRIAAAASRAGGVLDPGTGRTKRRGCQCFRPSGQTL
jgi:uncharacterized protein YaaQ